MGKDELVYPTPDYVKARREELKISAADLSRRMGYSDRYVALIEQENLPVTRKFAKRFWNVIFDKEQKRTAVAIVPLSFGVDEDTEIQITRKPVKCRCGCQLWFVPSSTRHRFLNRNHWSRWRRRQGEQFILD
ncbi:hypothetical protein ES705_35504 [subsurface metagenome]